MESGLSPYGRRSGTWYLVVVDLLAFRNVLLDSGVVDLYQDLPEIPGEFLPSSRAAPPGMGSQALVCRPCWMTIAEIAFEFRSVRLGRVRPAGVPHAGDPPVDVSSFASHSTVVRSRPALMGYVW